MTTTNTNADSNIVETTFNTKDGYNECDHCQSVLSPAAYFVKLVETVEKYITGHKLKERRPDLFELSLSCDSTNKTKLYLEIANEIMENNLNKKLDGNALQKLATAKFPLNLPANFPLISIRAYLEKQGISLADLYKVLELNADNVAESLGLSPEEYKTITDPTITDSHLKEVYGIDKSKLKDVEKFIAQINIDSDKLNRLVDCYNKLKNPPKKIYAGLENINDLDNQVLGFLHRFIRLANKLGWSFNELCDVLLAIDKNEIDANSLKEISRIKSLQEKLKKPLSEVCKLYSNASILIEGNKSEENAKNAAESLFFLQGIKDSQLKQEYGIEEPSEPFKEQSIGEFITQNEMEREQVERLLSNYNNGQFTCISKKIETINTKEQRFLHNFTQLTKRLALLFDKLSKNEFKLSDTVLQKIWNISDNELTSLINYNNQVSSEKEKPPILKVHKQILLARLMNISISEMIQILLHLNIDEVSTSNIENIVELNDWLNKNSLTIEQLNRSVNASALLHDHVEKISKIEEELKKSEDLESEKKLDLLLNHEDLTVQVKDKIRKELEKPEIKKLKNTEKLHVITRDSEFGIKVKGILEVLKSKDVLDSLMKDSELGIKVKGILEELESKEIVNELDSTFSDKEQIQKIVKNKELSSKEKLDKLINDSTIVEKDEIKKIIKSEKLNSKEKLNKLEFDSTLLEEYKTIINEIRERINEIRERRDELHNEIYKYFNVNADVLSATHQFTKKHGTNLQLLRLKDSNKNVDVVILGNKAVFIEEEKKDSVKVKMDKPRKNMEVAVIGTQTIFFGGKEDEKVSNKIDIYDAKTEKWTEHIASEGRDNASVAVVNKQVIFFGGNIGNKQYSKQVDIYNSVSNSWTSITNGESYDNVSVAIVGTKAIFFTEKKDNKKISQVYIYDSITKSWVKREGKKSSESSSNRTINSIKHCGKIDIYDNKAWKAIDIYKPDERNEIEIENDSVYITSSNNDEKIYSIKLSITYDATVEELLNNTDVFNTLNLNAEDIKNITNYVNIYNLKGTWTEKQIKMLTNYKTLQNVFSGNELTLSQYTDWLSDSYEENKVTEKIAQLTNWNKKLLDDIKKIETFKQCFEKENNPIDSLTKLKCFMDMEEKSGIAGNILLELKDLHNLSASTDWKKYLDTEKKLKESLSYVEGVKERLENYKRDILANYMLHKYSEIKNKNMRGLYAFLLIDVEMSDCSKISPLKAGLNSLQLYIHRCILGLEEGVTVNQDPENGLSEEMWNLLDNYREWEATKKIALYPENYLNPTLRKSATAEYKALQNTLMQGNLTDEEAANAYIQYFEDFAQLVNLNIVDTHFASEESKLYILGRAQAEPYTYYYRVGDLKDGKTGSQHIWNPWQKIEVQIQVKIARMVHAFGKLFIFWLQKIEKEKQIEDVSINDSTLSVNYIFKKANGNWSAQQKLPNEIRRKPEYEDKIKKYLSEIYEHEQHIARRGENDDANEYCKIEIKEKKELIKSEIEKLKDINFNGKLEVSVITSQGITIASIEEGFSNVRFILSEDLRSQETHISYLGNDRNESLEKAKQNIENLYEQKKTKYIKDNKEEEEKIQKQLDKKQKSVKDKQKECNAFTSKRNSTEENKKAHENKVNFIEKSITQRKDLWEKIGKLKAHLATSSEQSQNDLHQELIKKGNLQIEVNDLKHKNNEKIKLKGKLISCERDLVTLVGDIEKLATEETEDNGLQKKVQDIIAVLKDSGLQDTIKDPLEKSAKKVNLQKKASDLKEKLAKLKQDVESKIVESLKLVDLEKEITKLLGPEKTVETLEKEKDKLLEEISKSDELIKEFNKNTENCTKNIIALNDEISKLTKKKEKIEKSNTQINERERNVRLDEQKKEDIDLITKIINQKNSDYIDESKYKDEVILSLIKTSYKAAYIRGSEAVLIPVTKLGVKKFYDFYGVYLWEIFFHIPTLIAYLFNQEQKFAEACKWYQYIFNPVKQNCNVWQFIPFKNKCTTKNDSKEKCDSGNLVDSLDPYKEADNKAISYEKYMIISYVDNLIDWGDMLFLQNSWEGINQATMLYIRAWDLLGEKPKKKVKHKSEAQNVCQISSSNIKALCKAETTVPSGTSAVATITNTIEYCEYFCVPENKEFINLWNRIEDRLYKIRHCLDIKGKRLELPLFQPPIDPKQLISAAAGGSTIRLPKVAQVPHYRFKYMITYAKSIADTVTQIGSELLSVLEKKDAEALTLLYNKQEGIMANLMITIKEKSIEALKEDAKALNASLNSAKGRKSHYEKLIDKGWSALEISSMTLSASATVALTGAGVARQVAAGLHYIPTIFGFSNGGFQPGSSGDSIARGFELFASVAKDISQDISTSASYERRAQDWGLQKIMATHDVEQISHQIEANRINQANATQDLRAHEESIKQIREKEQFFRSKFTNQELYSWMKGELKSLYIRVYRLALEIAKQAEWAYQYEIDNDKTFIQPGHWNSLKEGLLSGQKLKFELEQLDKEYHDTNERRLEITKVISLKSLDPIALYELKTKGSCKFSFTEKLFDLDFPGHYARKIKDIKITIPAVVGPYENVHASLQQTSNQVVLKSDGAINAIKYLVNPSEEEQPETDLLRVNWKPNQEIAISKADQDSGLFELSFGDERYLPFEGTGAVSTWELSLPQATNRFNISTISDVIINLDYTALNGGEVLSSQVKNVPQLKDYQGTLIVNLSSVYPEEWEQFKQAKSELNFKLLKKLFPIHISNPELDLNNDIYIIPTAPDVSTINITMNNYKWQRDDKKLIKPTSLKIDSDWKMIIQNAEVSKIEEITILVPYKATINW